MTAKQQSSLVVEPSPAPFCSFYSITRVSLFPRRDLMVSNIHITLPRIKARFEFHEITPALIAVVKPRTPVAPFA